MLPEVLAPLTEDITQEGVLGLDIIRDVELALKLTMDIPLADPDEPFLEGQWAVMNSEGKAEAPGASSVPNVYPVWCGNGDRYDSYTTKQLTILTGEFIYRTSRYDTTVPVYSVGDALTIKGSLKVPTLAAPGDFIIGRVFSEPVAGKITIQVLRP